MQGNEVNTAFEILLEEIELIANQLNEDSAKSFKKGDYDKVCHRIGDLSGIARAESQNPSERMGFSYSKEYTASEENRPHHQRPFKTRTTYPRERFWKPVLETVVELGRKALVDKILKLVEKKMHEKLTK